MVRSLVGVQLSNLKARCGSRPKTEVLPYSGQDAHIELDPSKFPHDALVIWSLWVALAKRLSQGLILPSSDPAGLSAVEARSLLHPTRVVLMTFYRFLEARLVPDVPSLAATRALVPWFLDRLTAPSIAVSHGTIRTLVHLLQAAEHSTIKLTDRAKPFPGTKSTGDVRRYLEITFRDHTPLDPAGLWRQAGDDPTQWNERYGVMWREIISRIPELILSQAVEGDCNQERVTLWPTRHEFARSKIRWLKREGCTPYCAC